MGSERDWVELMASNNIGVTGKKILVNEKRRCRDG